MANAKNLGKPFERLVELLELLAATDARVEFAAKVPDRVTGKLRDVDVAVWIPSPHGPALYAIECKDHKRAIGVGVVEAVAQKGRDIRAHRVAIASGSGFTHDARIKAEHENIDLLTVREAGDTDWPEWVELRTVSHSTLRWELVGLGVPKSNGVQGGADTRISASIDDSPFQTADGKLVTAGNLVDNAMHDGMEDILRDHAANEPKRATFDITFSDGPLTLVHAGVDRQELPGVRLVMNYWLEATTIPLRMLRYKQAMHDYDVATALVSDPFVTAGQTVRLALIPDTADSGERSVAVRIHPAE